MKGRLPVAPVRTHIRLGLVVSLGLLLSACGFKQVAEGCVEIDGIPVVWRRDHVFDGEYLRESPLDTRESPDHRTGAARALADLDLVVVSGYWARTPNLLIDPPDPSARRCVDEDDRWVALATSLTADPWLPMSAEPQLPSGFWDDVTEHPWRFVRFGPRGGSTSSPTTGVWCCSAMKWW